MARYLLLLVCGMGIFTMSMSFGQTEDSLDRLSWHETAEERVDRLYALSYNYLNHQSRLSLEYGNEAYKLALNIHDSLRIVKTGLLAARAFRIASAVDSAIVIYEAILPISKRKGDLHEVVRVLNAYALTLTFNARYDEALSYHFESLNIAKENGDTLSVITALHNLGLVYYKLKDYIKALDYYNDCYSLKESVNDQYDSDILMVNMGLCYAYLRNYKLADSHIEEGLAICGRDCHAQRYVEGYFAKGVIYYGRNELSEAERYFLLSYSLAGTLNDIRFQLDNVDYLSQIYTVENRFSEAVVYLEAAENLIKQNSSFNLERIKIYSDFSKLYLQIPNFKRASYYQMKYSQLKDSIYNEEMTMNLMKAEAKFLERENREKIASQKEVIVLKEEIIRRQRILNTVTGLMIFFFIGFVLVLSRSYRKRGDLNCMLEKRVNERTRELQLSRDRLLTSFQEHDLYLNRTSQGIREIMHTIKGLCFTGMKELSDPVAQSYISRIDSVSGNLAHYLQVTNAKSSQI